MARLRVGVIGLGVGEKHLAAYLRLSACEVASACDFSQEKREEIGRRYPGVALSEDADRVLTDPSVQLVSIATFDNFHAGQVVKALDHGKHVFVEKPMCLYPSEAAAIRAALERNPGLRLSSNLVLRVCPRFVRLKAMIAEGRLGKVYHAAADYNYGRIHKLTGGWRGRIDFYSVVYGGGVHMIDLLRWLTGSEVAEVAAFGNRLVTEGTAFRHDDCVVSILRFENGVTARMTANFGCVFPHFHKVEVYGSAGTFLNGLDGGALLTGSPSGPVRTPVEEAYPGASKGELLQDFVEAVAAGRDPAISAEDVFRTMSVCFAVQESARTGRTLAVDYL